jgi:uncharacterized repeat protein (TIGR01451 family)
LQTANLTSLEKILDEKYKDEWEKDIAGVYLASSLKLMKQDEKASVMASKYKLRKEAQYFSPFYSIDLNNLHYIYLTAKHFPKIFKNIEKEALDIVLDIINNNRYNSLSASLAIMGLANFSDNIDANNVVFDLKNGKVDLEQNIVKNPFVTLIVPNKNVTEVSFKNDKPLYYSFVQKGFSSETQQKAFSKNIEATKKLTDLSGKEVTTASQGDELLITIKIQNLSKNFIENLAVVDLLPTGFEIKEVLSHNSLFSQNLREDRFLGYMYLPGNKMEEIVYKVRVTTKGNIIIPAVFGQDMYNNENQAQSESFAFTIEN